MYKFLVCVDPETATYYSYNLSNFQLHIEQIKSPHMRDVMKEKAKKACDELHQVISWAKFNKVESEEVERYRRRVLPTYLLRECTCQCYRSEAEATRLHHRRADAEFPVGGGGG